MNYNELGYVVMEEKLNFELGRLLIKLESASKERKVFTNAQKLSTLFIKCQLLYHNESA